jgi:FKBP-type peptidyl-prolyl cis-trans isomerase
MKKIIYLGILGLVLGSTSCLEDDEYEKLRQQEITELQNYLSMKGITYYNMDSLYVAYFDTSERTLSSAVIKKESYVLINYTLRLLDNTVVETNNVSLASKNSILPINSIEGPLMISIQYPPFMGVQKGLINKKENDSAVFIIPSNLGLGTYATSNIPAFSSLIYEVKVVKVIESPIAYDKSFWNRWVVDSMGLSPALTDTTEDGIFIKITYPGSNATTTLIQSGDALKVAYKGYLADGRSFSNNYDTIDFTVGNGTLISGFENAMYSLKQNSKAKISIPYTHGYGASGKTTSYQVLIPPYSSLYYDVVVVKVTTQ